MFALGQVDAVEELLLGLLDVVEDEVDELGVPLDATFFLTLADLYQDSGRTEDLHALRERYAAADARATRRATEVAGAAGEGSGAPAGVDLAKPAAVSAYLPPPPFASVDPVEDDEVLAHQLVAILATPAAEAPPAAPEATEPPAPEPLPEPETAATVEPPATEDATERSAVDLAEPETGRQLTPVERAVRGPRVRSL
jgi:hypothetical protein